MTKVRITFKNYFSITYFYHLQYKCALRSQVYSFKIFVHFQYVEIIDINFHVKQVSILSYPWREWRSMRRSKLEYFSSGQILAEFSHNDSG